MLRNLFAASTQNESGKHILASNLQALQFDPSKIAGMLAMFVVPISALGWWCYSFVLSVGAVAPLQSVNDAPSEVLVPQPSLNLDTFDTSTNAEGVTSSLSSSESVDVNVSNDSSQATVKIDGQSVPLSEQGTLHKVIHNDNGQTTVDVNIDSDTSGRTTTRSSTDIKVQSSSRVDVDNRSR